MATVAHSMGSFASHMMPAKHGEESAFYATVYAGYFIFLTFIIGFSADHWRWLVLNQQVTRKITGGNNMAGCSPGECRAATRSGFQREPPSSSGGCGGPVWRSASAGFMTCTLTFFKRRDVKMRVSKITVPIPAIAIILGVAENQEHRFMVGAACHRGRAVTSDHSAFAYHEPSRGAMMGLAGADLPQ